MLDHCMMAVTVTHLWWVRGTVELRIVESDDLRVPVGAAEAKRFLLPEKTGQTRPKTDTSAVLFSLV